MSADRIALAIDGGGTKTLACVACGPSEAEGRLIGRGESASSNPAAIGVEAAKVSLRDATEQALRAAGIQGPSVRSARIGLAGLEATNCRQDLQAWITDEFGIPDVRVGTDVELLLNAGQRQLPAIVLISGTGSTAFGRFAGRTARTGGRGYLLGDEGSGFWIGQRGLMAAIRALDHAAAPTSLVERIGDRLKAGTAELWTRRIYGADDPRQLIAGISQEVVDAATSGDEVAMNILKNASQELAILVISVAKQLQLNPRDYDLILAGGILTHVERVRDGLCTELAKRLPPHAMHLIAVPAEAAACRALEGDAESI